MGKVWPVGLNDEPIGWQRLPGSTEPDEQAYEEAVFREDDEPKPVIPVVTDWKAWKHRRAIAGWCLLGSGLLSVLVIRWETWFLFLGCCFAWSWIFWRMRELRHHQNLATIEHHLRRVQ